MDRGATGSSLTAVVLASFGLVACTVDWSTTADPAEVPTAAALDCTNGQVVTWTDDGWSCDEPPTGDVDYSVFGECEGTDKVTGFDRETGEVICAADLDTDADTLADVGPCDDEGEVLKREGDGWTCGADLDSDTLADLSECTNGQVLEWNDGWTCGADEDTDILADLDPCDDGMVLEWQDDGWACGEDDVTPAAGTVTSITAGDGIAVTGGEITQTGEIALADIAGLAAEVADRLATRLSDRLLPEGCEEDQTLVRTALGWECTSDPKCAPGFTSTTDGDFEICTRSVYGVVDTMVKVGDFWVDRYEQGDCPGSGNVGDDEEALTGSVTTAHSCSVANGLSSGSGSITWFQAAQLCANAGKRLCTNAEWQTAASGTPDAGNETADETECNVSGHGEPNGWPAPPGQHTGCVSSYGAYDMGGNIDEIVADWYAAPGTDELAEAGSSAWTSTFGDDGVGNVSGWVEDWFQTGRRLPAAARRGGRHEQGSAAGVFAFVGALAPSDMGATTGTRCCIGGAR